MRPYWKGYLKLAVVSCPIALHTACSTAERIALRQINKATGNRLRQQLIDEETREPVAPEHKGRGYEVAKGQYLVVEEEELDAIEIASTHVIEIDSFVPRCQIDQRFPEQAGCPGGLCGDPGRLAGQGHGGARPAGARQARADHRA
jgi:DNA end-binding protein Ku